LMNAEVKRLVASSATRRHGKPTSFRLPFSRRSERVKPVSGFAGHERAYRGECRWLRLVGRGGSTAGAPFDPLDRP